MNIDTFSGCQSKVPFLCLNQQHYAAFRVVGVAVQHALLHKRTDFIPNSDSGVAHAISQHRNAYGLTGHAVDISHQRHDFFMPWRKSDMVHMPTVLTNPRGHSATLSDMV